MGTCTLGKLTTNPTYETVTEALKFIKGVSEVSLHSVKEPKMTSYRNNKGNEVPYFDKGTAYINFVFQKDSDSEVENRSMFLIRGNTDSEESYETPTLTEKYTYCSINMWGSSVHIIEELASILSGIVIPNDCADTDSEDFFRIINSETEFVINEKLLSLFNNLGDMNAEEKYKFVKNIEKHSEEILDYIAN